MYELIDFYEFIYKCINKFVLFLIQNQVKLLTSMGIEFICFMNSTALFHELCV